VELQGQGESNEARTSNGNIEMWLWGHQVIV
jgi:hypothetical protein